MENENIFTQIKEAHLSKIETNAMSFISAGIACNALVTLFNSRILSTLKSNKKFSLKELRGTKYKNLPLLKSALISLEQADILVSINDEYHLTKLGHKLSSKKKIALIQMLFEGYGKLISHQVELTLETCKFDHNYINYNAIAEASINFGEESIDPLVIDIIKKLEIIGTICDLGCGCGTRLIKICKQLKIPGLGFEINNKAVSECRKKAKEMLNFEVHKCDITNLQGIWEDVTILMQSFVLHDIASQDRCISIFSSYKQTFPNMKYFLSIDIISPSKDHPLHMPGFDYVHGLQGITTRNYQETIDLFTKAGYSIFKEYPINEMPNTFLWILYPKN